MKRLFLLAMMAGCSTRPDSRYCDGVTACADPAYPYCDLITNECETSGYSGDMPIFDIAVSTPDLNEADDMNANGDMENMVDLSSAPDLFLPCVASVGCTAPTAPICDTNTKVCRACVAGDDCGALFCKTAGPKAGECTECNVAADCPAASPVCTSDGKCRTCTTGSECTTGVCDLRPGATLGQCVATTDIVYVDNTGSCSGSTGTASKPFCDINAGVGALSNAKHFVKVEGSMTPYASIVDTSTQTAFIAGPGRDASLPARVTAAANKSAISLIPATSKKLNYTIDGLIIVGTGNTDNVICDASVGGTATAALTIRNSAVQNGGDGVRANFCALTVTETVISGNAQFGVNIQAMNTWVLQNDVIYNALSGGVNFDGSAGTGTFQFNTLAFNGTTGAAGGVVCSKAITLESSIISQNTVSATGTQFNDKAGGACILTNVATGTDSVISTGKLAGTPVFRTATDLRLKVSSPADITANQACCIDKVTPTAATPTIDFERDTRPIGASLDVGADEAL